MENVNVIRSIDTVVDGEGIVHPKGSGFGGKYNRLPSIYREKLSKAIPSNMISKHPTKTFLSVIKAIAVVERMNDVFGINGWNLEHETVEITTLKVKEGEVPYVVMKGRIYVREFDLYTPYQYGGHQLGGKGTEPADGYKSAVTDIQSKCASYLEIGIQVFKGQPTSQQANTSKRKDEHSVEEATKNMVAKTVDEMPEPVKKKAPAKRKTTAKKKEVVAEVAKVEAAVAEVCDDKSTLQQESDDLEITTYMVDAPADPMEIASESILSYKKANDLKENATVIIFNAQMDGATEEQLSELKVAINTRYKELLNA